MTVCSAPLLDKDTAEGPNAKTQAIGTGPFVFDEWAQGDQLSFKRNANYWQAGTPYLDEVRVNIRHAVQDSNAIHLDQKIG